jgi:hypothetical protein
LEKHLIDIGADWYRYGAQNYVLWTDLPLADLAPDIVALPGYSNVYIFVSELPMTTSDACNGLMPHRFWEWLQKPR